MTRKTKIYQDPKKLLRSIVIGAGVITAAYFAPKALKAIDDRLQDANYAEEHHAIKNLSGILQEREANALKRGEHDDPNDPFVQSVTKELNYRQKRHAAEKRHAKCKYCEAEK